MAAARRDQCRPSLAWQHWKPGTNPRNDIGSSVRCSPRMRRASSVFPTASQPSRRTFRLPSAIAASVQAGLQGGAKPWCGQYRQLHKYWFALTTGFLPGRTSDSLAPMAMSSAASRVAVRAHRALLSSSVPRRAIHASSAPAADQRQHSDRSAWHNVSAGPADHYRILNIPHHATKAEIKRAYLNMGEPKASRRCLGVEHCIRRAGKLELEPAPPPHFFPRSQEASPGRVRQHIQ